MQGKRDEDKWEARRLIAHFQSHGNIISNTGYTIINLFKNEEQNFVPASKNERRKTLEKGGTVEVREAGRGRNGGGVLKRAVELR